ncbi:hypothetical protein ACEPAI_7424 [Sanghuangporus weigelae]
MDPQSFYDELYSAVQEYTALIANRTDEQSQVSVLPHVVRAIDNAQLERTEIEMIDARKRCEDALRQLRRSAVTLTECQCPARTLPLEAIQYIIALAYENEFEDCQISDFREGLGYSGAMGLATAQDHPNPDNALFSLTTLPIRAGYTSEWCDINSAPKARYRVKFRGSIAAVSPSVAHFIQKRANEVRILEVSSIEQLEYCIPVFPNIEHLSKARTMDDVWPHGEPDKWEGNNIRSATIDSDDLESFTSSGVLRNVTHLSVSFGGLTRSVTLDQILSVLPEFPRLVSLGMRYMDDIELIGKFAQRASWYKGATKSYPELHCLRRLTLSSMRWLAEVVVFCFCRCDLTEISFDGINRNSWKYREKVEPLSRKLSDTFPRLEKLALPSLNVREMLCRRTIETDGAGSEETSGIHTWNFPKLHTLDIRGGESLSWEAQLLDSKDVIYDSVGQLLDIKDVIYERHAAAAATSSAKVAPAEEDINGSINTAVVAPINRLCMDCPQIEELDETFKCHRMLVYLELERIVPNFIWDERVTTLFG